MILRAVSQERRRFLYEQILLWGLFSLVLLYAFWVVFSFFSEASLEDGRSGAIQKPKVEINHQNIGYGPLSLNGIRDAGPLPGLSKELLFLGMNTRPDVSDAKRCLIVTLKSSGEEKTVFSGDVIYLEKNGDRFGFSATETDLEVCPMAIDSQRVMVEVVYGGVKGSMVVPCRANLNPTIEKSSYFLALKEAKNWGRDVLISSSGGDDFHELAEKTKIEIGSQFIFLSPGEKLIWRGEQWENVATGWETASLPLAEVTLASDQRVDLKVWNETGSIWRPRRNRTRSTPPRAPQSRRRARPAR